MSTLAWKEFKDCALTTFRGSLLQSPSVLGKKIKAGDNFLQMCLDFIREFCARAC